MDVYLLRHGLAVEHGTPGYPDDFERPLTAEGKQKLRKIAKALGKMELSFDLILSSPYVRARESAEIVGAALAPRKKLQLRESLGADGSFRELIAEVKAVQPAPESLLLVGHEPYLSTLISLLVAGTTKSCVALKKAGLCKLTVEALRAGRCARLEWLLTPRQMLLMS